MHVAGYKLTKRLASGTSGTVYTAKSTPATAATPSSPPSRAPALVAVKLVPGGRVSPAVLREVCHLRALSHPCVLTLHAVALVPAPPGAPPALALVTELLPAGDLFDAVAGAAVQRKRLRFEFVREVARDVARGLLHMKRKGVVHADLKLENVALVNEPEMAEGEEAEDGKGACGERREYGDVVAKIIDLGTSRPAGDAPLDTSGRAIGTAQYLAPELLRYDAGSPRSVPTFATDAWACGVLLFSMMTGSYPFEPEVTTDSEANDGEAEQSEDLPSTEATAFAADHARDAILNLPPLPMPNGVPMDLREIVTGLLRKDPSRRMTCEDILERLGYPLEDEGEEGDEQGEEEIVATGILSQSRRKSSGERIQTPSSIMTNVFEDAEDDVSSDHDGERGKCPGGEGNSVDDCEVDESKIATRTQSVSDMVKVVRAVQRHASAVRAR